jgi:hypothetical protein
LTEPPRATEAEPGEAETAKSTPVPLNVAVYVLALLSVTVSVPLAEPIAAALKVTEIVQLEPPATVGPQLLVSENAPLVVMLRRFKARLPELENVAVSGALEVPSG